MSIPGFAASAAFEEPTLAVEVTIPARAEWRFECPFKLVMKVKIIEGVAEIFGTELPNDVEVRLTGCKYAIYAPLAAGCRLQYEVGPNKEELNISNEDAKISEYLSDDSPALQYTNAHFALEVMRHEAAASTDRNGPRVLVLGSSQSGKTALAKTLAAYAVKMDRVPLFVNLDPKTGVFSVPGSLTATPISDAFDLESVNGWGGSTTSGATYHNPKQPLVKSFGFYEFSENVDLYKHQVAQLGIACLSRASQDDQIRTGGLIVDTPSLSMKDAAVVENIVADFDINIILVTGSDRLAVDLKRKFAHKIARQTLDVVKMARNSAVAEVDDSFVRKAQEDTIKEYFNGNFKTRLSPYKTDVDMKNYTIYKTVKLSEYASQMAFLPAGDSSNLENSIIAITQAPVPANGKIAPRDLLNASVLGYAHVSKVDDAKCRMSLLLPFPGQIPRNVLIATSIGYTE
ncbi:hypothetical protein METBIDRAFT_72015 [Metschnikowia bicuspidata var. bicuspidata NRRL YB-4993]|uniref:Polynucleotide 5'-hydroxyl-kinase GRC3 n=1 Tax=Metschnikowia bicuspidata var. bicuspidata NRRL YB-4993 TaxID=869754 RepID=A0A1A0HA49_9ASCO|nr:hypothetical protein METBIDRAFT_72015 [Metschnikowia bicuspidata var. bicuspidata NRRL YB-4993]OBA20748.1 hypothetical protein METBIDRAFT_72015 [Metschnikowia bicuspidata var. bicuspidata NRRL YB-4993]